MDSDFGTDGSVYFEEGDGVDQFPGRITTQYDGKILVTGYDDGNMAVWRLNVDGTVDTEFADAGEYRSDQAFGDSGYDITVDHFDESIFVTGNIGDGGGRSMAIWKLTPDGAPDPSFGGGNGYITDDADEIASTDGTRIIIEGDGDILVGGFLDLGLWNYAPLIWRFDEDGNRDTTLDSIGYVYMGMGGLVSDLVSFEDGSFTALRADLITGRWPSVYGTVCEYAEDGSLDPTFGIDGCVTIDEGVFYGTSLEIMPGSTDYLVVGYSIDGGSHIDLYMYDQYGDLVTTFGENGVIEVIGFEAAVSTDGYVSDTIVTSNGYIIIVGDGDSSGLNPNSIVLKYKYAFQISGLPAGLEAVDYLAANIEVGSEFGVLGDNLVLLMTDDGYPLALTVANFTEDLDWSDVTGDVDWVTKKSVVTGLDPIEPLNITRIQRQAELMAEGTYAGHVLYVPKGADDDYLLICPDATTLAEVVTGCPNGEEHTEDDGQTVVVTYDGDEYWVFLGALGTGGMSFHRTLQETGMAAGLPSMLGIVVGAVAVVPVVTKRRFK